MESVGRVRGGGAKSQCTILQVSDTLLPSPLSLWPVSRNVRRV